MLFPAIFGPVISSTCASSTERSVLLGTNGLFAPGYFDDRVPTIGDADRRSIVDYRPGVRVRLSDLRE